MEKANARQPTTHDKTMSFTADISQKSSSYKEALSQPAPGLSHVQKLQWLQMRRTAGLWAQCDDCGRWRHLPHIIDSHELPEKWYCKLNPDKSLASCSAPEVPICLRDEEDLIYNEYSAGSVVWARLPGWPWWPAMVDDCPDNEQFFWLDGFSDIPTHYNVVFFDKCDVTRAWIAPKNMKPFSANKLAFKTLLEHNKYKIRIEAAVKQADDAIMLSLTDRLKKYSFLARYTGTIYQPRSITKTTLNKFNNQLKRKYNVNFSDASSSETDTDEIDKITKTSNKNVIILGTPKMQKTIKPKCLNDTYNTQDEGIENTQVEKTGSIDDDIGTATNELRIIMEPDSTSAQMGSSEKQDTINESSKVDCCVNVIESIGTTLQTRVVSPSSDDFDF